MKRWIASVSVAVLLAGCQQTSLKQVKEEAQVHWQQTRARVMYGVAVEQFKAGQLDRATEKVCEALALVPNDAESLLLLGRIHIEQGRSLQAVVELKRASDQLPKSFEAVFMLGVAEEKSGRLDEALACYQKAMELDATSAGAVLAATEVMVAMGRAADAQAFLDAHIELAGDDPAMFELSGRLAMMLEDYPLAARDYAEAADLSPVNTRYREALAHALFLSRQYAEAVEAVRALVKMPKYAPPTWLMTLMGDCHVALGQWTDARLAYQSARDLAPEEPRAWTNVAKASLELGDAHGAVQAAQEALHRDPHASDAFCLLGYALLKDGQTDKATQVLAGAVEQFPEHIVLRCLLGRCYAAAGDVPAAARCYTAVLKIEPDNPLAKELLAATAPKARRPGE